jgi:hypothetical protein
MLGARYFAVELQYSTFSASCTLCLNRPKVSRGFKVTLAAPQATSTIPFTGASWLDADINVTDAKFRLSHTLSL